MNAGSRRRQVVGLDTLMRTKYLGPLLIVALVAAIGYVAYLEPIVHDSWGHWVRMQQGVAKALSFWAPGRGNPRIGDAYLPLMYFDFPVHALLNGACYATLFTALFVLVTGSTPRWTRARDVLLWLGIPAAIWTFVPYVGELFFYRPNATNYVYGITFTLIIFVPLRLWSREREAALAPSRWRRGLTTAWWFLMGGVAGMCNEHTGPVAIVIYLGWIYHIHRTARPVPRRFIGCAAALTVGYLYLFFAKGQRARYDGLATKTSFIENVILRGWQGNWELLQSVVAPMLPLLAVLCLTWAVVVVVTRRHRQLAEAALTQKRAAYLTPAILVAAALATLFVTLFSPLVHDRLLFAPMLLLIATAAWVLHRITLLLERQRAVVASLCAAVVAAHVWFFAQMIPLYQRVHEESQQRIAALMNAPTHSRVGLAPLSSNQRTHYFLGDELLSPEWRAVVADKISWIHPIDEIYLTE